LRIEVNGEWAALESVLPDAIAALALHGRIAVLAYHSLEDRLVKQIFGLAARDRAPRDLPVVPAELRPQLRQLTHSAMRPSEAELARNPRAASARLRAAMRIAEMAVAG
jgi:16S rRNA (cytosine1402-N4)-methyltransferase